MPTEGVPAISHVDGRALGISLFRWMDWYRDEIDEIVEDGWDGEWSPRYPHEESYVVDWYARHFETELEAHWTAQAKGRKPVLVEPRPGRRARERAEDMGQPVQRPARRGLQSGISARRGYGLDPP